MLNKNENITNNLCKKVARPQLAEIVLAMLLSVVQSCTASRSLIPSESPAASAMASGCIPRGVVDARVARARDKEEMQRTRHILILL